MFKKTVQINHTKTWLLQKIQTLNIHTQYPHNTKYSYTELVLYLVVLFSISPLANSFAAIVHTSFAQLQYSFKLFQNVLISNNIIIAAVATDIFTTRFC
jgi:hypothetical protein